MQWRLAILTNFVSANFLSFDWLVSKWSRCQLTSFREKMKRIVIQFLDSNSLSKIPNIFSWQRRTGTKPTSSNFQHVGILVSETLSKKRMSGHPGCPKFRTFSLCPRIINLCVCCAQLYYAYTYSTTAPFCPFLSLHTQSTRSLLSIPF